MKIFERFVFIFGLLLFVSAISFYLGFFFSKNLKQVDCSFKKDEIFLKGFNTQRTKIINGTIFSLKEIKFKENIILIYEDIYQKNKYKEVVSWEK